MMKHLRSVSLALMLMTALLACKKDAEPAEFSMVGKWEGKIGQNQNAPSGYFALNLKSNGTIERIDSDGDVNATGTWDLEGEEFTAIYTYPGSTVVFVEGTVDKSQKKLTGNWENSGDEVGTFYATQK